MIVANIVRNACNCDTVIAVLPSADIVGVLGIGLIGIGIASGMGLVAGSKQGRLHGHPLFHLPGSGEVDANRIPHPDTDAKEGKRKQENEDPAFHYGMPSNGARSPLSCRVATSKRVGCEGSLSTKCPAVNGPILLNHEYHHE